MATTGPSLDLNALKMLYNDVLYSIDKQVKPPSAALPAAVKKKYLILLFEHAIPGDPLYQFLTGILNACKIGEADANIISGFRQDADHLSLQAEYGARFVIMFGVEAADLKLPVFFPHYQVQAHNGITYISSPELAVIENDKAAKQKLWQSLKKAFSL
jgi:hypothetical protein